MDKNVSSREVVTGRLIGALGEKQEELEHTARVLHEDVGQILTVVGLQIEVLGQDFGGQAPGLGSRVEEIQQLLEKAIGDVRELSYRLNPGIVPRSGLRYALDTLVGQVRETSSANVRLLIDSHVHLPQPVAVAMFDIAAHALHNAAQHADARRIELVLQPMQDHVRLEVRDDGKGFAPAGAMDRGLGLPWMDYRAKRAGIILTVESEPYKGTVVQALYRETAGQHEQQTKQSIDTGHGEVKGYAIRDPIGG